MVSTKNKKGLNLFGALLNLFVPSVCVTCGKGILPDSDPICLSCYYDMPLTEFHLREDNPAARTFWGRVFIESCTALFYFFKESRYQRMIHQLKYNKRIDIGHYLGHLLGRRINESPYFKNLDCIVPVPLHKNKLKKRGYNQSYHIALGIHQVLDIPVRDDFLERTSNTSTQTQKSKEERWQNVRKAFKAKIPKQEKLHVLLVDDILTTGSTLEACATELLKNEHVRVSIAVLGFA